MIFTVSIGIEVGPNRLRALRLGHGRHSAVEAMEVEWSVADPDDAVAALRERFGTGARVAVAVDISALLVKRIALPPLPAEQRRQMVALDPERYFPVREEPLLVGVRDDDLVVATRAEPFDRLTDALAALGVVERVEPAPSALARHLTVSGATDAVFVMANPHDQDCAVVSMRQGQMTAIRKVPSEVAEIAAAAKPASVGTNRSYLYPWSETLADELTRAGLPVEPVPAPRGSAECFAAAHGALLGIDGPEDLTLTSPTLARQHAARAGRRAVLATMAVFLALAAALWSVDLRRERTLAELERRITQRRDQAAEVQDLLEEIADGWEELRTLAAVSSDRQNPLEVLLLVTHLLPTDAYLRSFSATGDSWELDGYAHDAARLIPTLEESNVLQHVEFRSATTRVRLFNENYESFSLAFRYIPAPE